MLIARRDGDAKALDSIWGGKKGNRRDARRDDLVPIGAEATIVENPGRLGADVDFAERAI